MNGESIKKFKSDNQNLLSGVAGVLILFLLALTVSTIVGIVNDIRGVDDTQNTISVSGSGEVYVKPDLGIINFSVTAEKDTVGEALSFNSEKMNNVIEFVKSEVVEEGDIKTTNFNIYPRYEWYEKSEIYPAGKRVLAGYEVRQTLQVKVRDLEKLSTLIEGATTNGANEVGNLQFTVEDKDDSKKEARRKAIQDAKEKANQIANQLGVKLSKIVGFNESSDSPVFYYDTMREEGIKGAGGAPQIETGENKIEVNVNITYRIR